MQNRSPVFAFRSFSPAAQKQSICSTRASSLSTLSSYIGEDIGVALTMIRVQFLGVTEQDGHCVYMVQVDSGTEQLVITKRYSEFRALRQLLFTMLHQGQHCGNGPCKHLHQLTQVTFPHRKWQWTKGSELILAQERLGALQRFVEAILHVYRMAPKRQLRRCSNMRCLAMEEIGRFLGIDIPAFDDVLAGPLLSPSPLRA
uniref:PX domain-containing protein n=1 Tax=Globisporangium ultimum (strain ATCC 200006 / CBS 805.95 / DAOM BR144) TaxID=431595 RepID=K3W923_GLOUD